MDSILFRRACAQFATGVAIASAFDSKVLPHGMTINSFTAVSLDPPLVLISVDRTSNLLPIFEHCGHYGLSFLGLHQQGLSSGLPSVGRTGSTGWRGWPE
jgi:flavin reductase (DIM6/NTAB) family NADH-FMN oxidoreductase RutF